MAVLDTLKKYAPGIAMAFATGGATLPQMAAQVVADVVGEPVRDAEEADRRLRLASPQQIEQMKKADHDFLIRNQELFNERFIAALADKQNARAEHKNSRMPAVITVLLTLMVCAGFYVVAVLGVQKGSEQITYMIVGQVIGVWVSSVVYWVGTSLSSAKKNSWADQLAKGR